MIKYGGVGIIYMDGHIFFPLRGGKQIHDNSFLICLFIFRLLHRMRADGVPCSCCSICGFRVYKCKLICTT